MVETYVFYGHNQLAVKKEDGPTNSADEVEIVIEESGTEEM